MASSLPSPSGMKFSSNAVRRRAIGASLSSTALFVGSLLGACSSSNDEASTSPAGDQSVCRADGGAAAESDAGLACTTLEQRGACYDVVNVKSLTPPAGGKIADGVYVATAARVVNADAAEGTRALVNAPATLKIENGAFERVVDPGTAPVANLRDKGTLASKDATTLTLVVTCPQPATQLEWRYTVTPTTLIMQDSLPGWETVWQKL